MCCLVPNYVEIHYQYTVNGVILMSCLQFRNISSTIQRCCTCCVVSVFQHGSGFRDNWSAVSSTRSCWVFVCWFLGLALELSTWACLMSSLFVISNHWLWTVVCELPIFAVFICTVRAQCTYLLSFVLMSALGLVVGIGLCDSFQSWML